MKKYVALVVAVIIFGFSFMKSVQLKQNCTGYLKRAADANSVEMAKSQLGLAIHYLEENQLTAGYTSVIYRTPDEDIGYWYSNLKSCQKDLSDTNKLKSVDADKLMLLKLRQTLLDQTKNGESVTIPKGLAYFPQNLVWGIARGFALLAIFYAFFLYSEKRRLNLFSRW